MGWRDKYKVHPAADVFPMLPDEELDALAEDIKAHGIRVPIGFFTKFDGNGKVIENWLIDGRNRLAAAERAGIDPSDIPEAQVHCSDPVSWIISLNIRRRHLTKQQQADLIVAAIKAGEKPTQAESVSRQDGEKLKEGRPRDETKAAIVSTAAEHGISKRTAERAIAKAEGPKSRKLKVNYTVKTIKPPVIVRTIQQITIEPGIDAARSHYAAEFSKLPHSGHAAEIERLSEALGVFMHSSFARH
jgi:ParB-like chromosome segregation protein Spo0J